jgi:hypothetical protein
MQPLSTSELLRVWEQGQSMPSYQKAMLILSAACPDESAQELAELSIGRRDSRLMTLRGLTFGPQLTSLTECPACNEKLEFSLNVADIRCDAPESKNQLLQAQIGDYSIDFRPVNTVDLMEAGRGAADLSRIQGMLIKRCVREIRRQEEKPAVEHLPPHVVEALTVRMTEADPQADIRLSLCCPACSHGWQAAFDIVSFFWSEIEDWALRTLREIHLLASAYAWREADILAMSSLRRHIYLGMIGR